MSEVNEVIEQSVNDYPPERHACDASESIKQLIKDALWLTGIQIDALKASLLVLEGIQNGND